MRAQTLNAAGGSHYTPEIEGVPVDDGALQRSVFSIASSAAEWDLIRS